MSDHQRFDTFSREKNNNLRTEPKAKCHPPSRLSDAHTESVQDNPGSLKEVATCEPDARVEGSPGSVTLPL